MEQPSPSQRDPAALERVRTLLAAQDPEILAAVEEVDRSLIALALREDPWDRLRASLANGTTLLELRRCMPLASTR